MQTIFSTAEVPQAEAFDYWVDAWVAITDQRVNVETFEPGNFYAEVQTAAICDITLVDWRSSPGISRNISCEDHLVLYLPGSRTVAQFGDYCFEQNHSSLSLIDCHRPFTARSLEPADRMAVRIPRDTLGQRIRLTKEIVNRPVPLQGDAALLTAFARQLVRIGPSTLSPVAVAIVREQMIDLTAVMLSGLTGVTPRIGAANRYATLKLRAAIDTQLTDPNADRASIAAAAGISERHANRLLALEGTSVWQMMLDRRLNLCRVAIKSQLQCSISDIASAHGFRDLNQFTRAFKTRYGMTPREYRNSGH